MAFPGRRTRISVRISKGFLLAVLTILGFTAALPVNPAAARSDSQADKIGNSTQPVDHRSQLPNTVGANSVPNLRLPEEVMSGVGSTSSTGFFQTDSQNLTLYTSTLALRLLGGSSPHDELDPQHSRGTGPSSSWSVEFLVDSTWIPLKPRDSSLAVIGTNTTGTYVAKTMIGMNSANAGVFGVVYSALSNGRMKWNLNFTAGSTSHYRLALRLSDVYNVSDISAYSKHFNLGPSSYILSWSDVPHSFDTNATLYRHVLLLTIDLGQCLAGSRVQIDPSLVGTDNDSLGATTYSYQHHIYQDPKTGYYWIFYHDPSAATGLVYKYSADGINWYPNPYYTFPSAWLGRWSSNPVSSPAIYFQGETVVLASGNSFALGGLSDGSDNYVYMAAVVGTILGTYIKWGSIIYPFAQDGKCRNSNDPNPFNCYASAGIRYLSVALDSSGRIWISLNGYYYTSPYAGNACLDYYSRSNVGFYDESYVYLVMVNSTGSYEVGGAGNNNGSKGGCYRYDLNEHMRSVVLPADTRGGTRIIFQGWNYSYSSDLSQVTGTTVSLYAQWYNGLTPISLMDTIEPVVADTDEFSAVSDLQDGTRVGTHVVYRGTDGNVTYAYRSPFGPGWTYEKNIFNGVQVSNPVVTTDYSTGDAYAFGTTSPIDGSASAWCGHNTNSCSAKLTTSKSNDIIIVYTSEALDLQGSCTFSVNDAAGLTWAARNANPVFGNGGRDELQEFYAKSIGALSSDTITESISGCASTTYGGEYNGLQVLAISGANFNSPFDPNSGLPGTTSGTSGTPSVTISTNNSNDLIIGGAQLGGPAFGTGGFAIITATNGGGEAAEYEPVGLPVTNLPVGFGGSSGNWEEIADAIQLTSASSIIMRTRALSDHFADHSILYPVIQRNNVTLLESSFSVASSSNSSYLALIWTEPTATSSYNVMFASIPVQTVWSPYGLSRDPWDGNGLAPYGQYFQNLGEKVSPSTGMLTVEQTDLSVPGRGLSLDLTRVYTEPYSFLNGSPYNYESYPWAPLGDGWQFNFPWMSNANNPLYLHLWHGEGYRIPSGFWSGSTATFESHQGENFRLVRYVNGTIILLDKSGTSYVFGTIPNHGLVLVRDSTGNNTITLNYSSNAISCISDTVQRTFLFSYSGGLVQNLSQVTGSCASPGSTIRRVTFSNNGQSLTSVMDPANRVTTYSYGSNPWLLSRITYPTRWYDSFIYTGFTLGTQATSYRVSLQQANTSQASIVRQFSYTYAPSPGDQIISASVTSYNGTQVVSYTKYAFSFIADIKNVTDASGTLLNGDEQVFGVGGEISKDITIVSDSQGHLGSYTNYYRYDLWGNRIYSRQAINPSTNAYHETFNAYYNNGEPPGFYAFQESFSQNQGTTTDSPWNVQNGYWMVQNGVYNGTEAPGPEESVIANSDINKTDISLQARMYITRQVNTTTTASYRHRFGIFTHYAGGPLYHKWALVIHTTGATPALELLDEWYQWLGPTDGGAGQSSAISSCSNWTVPLISPGAWYTFNMTVRGTQASGWVSVLGQPQCSVNGTFSSSSPALNGTGFGLYAGGYSALFDDVMVATVSPTLTTTGFSNSFGPNGAPGLVGLNSWLITDKPADPGWNSAVNWTEAEGWSTAYRLVDYGGPPWGGTVPGWTDSQASWIWWQTNASTSGSADPIWLRRVFLLPTATSLTIRAVPDDFLSLYVDGSLVVSGNGGQTLTGTITRPKGFHVLAVYATNPNGPDPAGLMVSVVNTSSGIVLFHTDGVAGPNLVRLAGTAQLQNGSASAPVESYYGYYPWGGLYQTKQLYNSGIGQWIITSRTYDIYGNLKTATDPRGNMTSYAYSPNYQSAYPTSKTQTLIPGGGFISYSYIYNFTTGTTLSTLDPNGLSTSYRYDILGRLVGETFPTGDFAGYTYNDPGNYLNITNENGWKTQRTYDGLARLASAKRFANGTVYSSTTYNYNWMDKVASQTDALGNATAYRYDVLGRRLSVNKPDGTTQNWYYNDTASWIRFTDEAGNYKCTYYDRMGRLISVVENATPSCGPGIVTNYYYDEVGNLVRTVKSATNQFVNPGFETGTFYGWTVSGMIITSFSHSGGFSAAQGYAPGGGCSASAFTLQQNFSNMIPGSMITAFQFWYSVAFGGPNVILQVLYSDGTSNQTQLPFPSVSLGWSLVNVSVDKSRYVAGVLISRAVASPNPCVPIAYFDDFLLVVAPETTSFSYDNLNRLVQTNYSDQTSESYIYDSNGNPVRVTDRKGSTRLYSYDSLNRVSTINYGNSASADSYTYDKAGNLLQLLSQNATIGYTYDSRNRVTEECYYVNTAGNGCPPSSGGGGGSVPAGTLITLANGTRIPVQNVPVGTQLIVYNVPTGYQTVATVSQIAKVTTSSLLTIQTSAGLPFRADANPQMKLWVLGSNGPVEKPITMIQSGDQIYNYDLGSWVKVTNVIVSYGGQHIMYDLTPSPAYTSNGLLLEYIANGYPDCYIFCKLGPTAGPSSSPSAGIVSNSYTVSYTYSGENLYQIRYPSGNTYSYAYDSLGRVASVSKSNTTYASFTYYRNDQVKTITFGNSLSQNYGYDTVSRISNIVLTYGKQTFLSLTYGYNKTGTVNRVTGQVNSAVNEAYSYDPLARLTNAVLVNGQAQTNLLYQYDNLGNRQGQSSNNILTTYNYNLTNDELISSTTSGVTTTYSYDSDGNLLSRTSGSNAWMYVWDAPGHLVKVSMNNAPQAYYAYDGSGRRVESVESGTVFYAYLGTETLSEKYANSTYNEYVYAGGIRIARVSSTSTAYYHTDALGSTRLATDANRIILFYDNYQPFGQDNTSSGSETYKFTGKLVSQTTGLYYEYQRWYDPTIGRFISWDPLAGDLSDPQSLNPYIYVEDSPTSYTDPSGMAFAPPNLHGSSCPEILQASFWSNPLGSIECHFGTAGTVRGGGVGGGGSWGEGGAGPGTGVVEPDPGAAIVVGALWAIWGGYELYSHWDEWFGDHGSGTTSPSGLNGSGGATTPGLTSGTGPITTLPGIRRLTPDIGIPSDMGRGTVNMGRSGLGQGTGWTVGFSNGYVSNLRKAVRSPLVGALCVGGAGFVALGLWAYESEESARQNIGDQQDYGAIWGGLASLCYGVAAAGYSVAGSF